MSAAHPVNATRGLKVRGGARWDMMLLTKNRQIECHRWPEWMTTHKKTSNLGMQYYLHLTTQHINDAVVLANRDPNK